MKKIFNLFVLSLLLLNPVSCQGKYMENSEPPQGRFAPCPNAPKCVNSEEDKNSHYIQPIAYSGEAHPFTYLKPILDQIPKGKWMLIEENYLYITYSSKFFGFVDDVEFHYNPKAKLIHMRGSARTGYYDFGVNKQRLEKIRTEFLKASQKA